MAARSKEVTCGLVLHWHFTYTDTRGRQLLRTRSRTRTHGLDATR